MLASLPNPYYSRSASYTLDLADAEWKKVLPADVYYIARKAGLFCSVEICANR